MRRTTSTILAALTSLALLAGCGSDGGTTEADDADPGSGRTRDVAPAASDEPAGDPATPAASATSSAAPDQSGDTPTEAPAVGTSRQEGKASQGANLVLTDVRAAENAGYDRIVMEFSGTGTPGWGVEYVDEPVQEGSGKAIDLDGESYLQVVADSTTWPAPDYYDGPTRIDPEGDGNVDEVYVGGTFEGYTALYAGVEGDRAPFRVFTLTSPTRLVVDVARSDDDGAPAEPATPAADLPPFPAGTRRQSADPAPRTQLLPVDVRVAENDGFDRVVVEFTGRGRPGWTVDYRPRAVQEGSGRVVRLQGDTVLQVFTSYTTFLPESRYYDGPRRLRPAGDGNVEEVFFGGTFEGYTQLFAGLDDRTPFRVFTLSNPTRLVVDVQHDD
ncbi:hypothetical protein GCM10023340_31920 [Nocardioides marinquilinus]|uniref:AMIN-like domain-containing protein n=1 Tax=Nocardioides marinquilinus TaxID=1210400 RepID=A0ABP9Q0H8_9ACTN